jgi:hypothetical protein
MATVVKTLTSGSVGNMLAYGAGGAISPALSPLTQTILNEVWPLRPVVPISPTDAAAMAVQGVMSEEDAAKEAELSGIASDRFHKLFLVNGNPIAPEQALDLWNRGEIKEEDVARALLQSRLKPEWVDTFKLLRRQLLQAAELAEMVVQDVLTQADATDRAAALGIHADDFAHLVRLAGNPPGPQDTLSLWNRNLMTEEEATLALRQSRLKPEWIDIFKRSRIRPATTAQAVEAVVRQRITHDEGAKIAAENGIDAQTFALMVNTAGRPIGIVQALTLYNRKVYGKAQVEEVVARSDVRAEYTDAILHLAVRYPSILQVRQLVAAGAVSDEYATRLLVEQGYPHDLAVGVVAAGHGAKTAKHRDLTVSEVETLYQGGGLSRDDATGMIQQLGYDATEAALILDLAEFRRIARFIEAVINRVHAQFVAHRIDVDVITTELDRVGVPTDQREQLIDLWSQERAANVRTLTEAQVHRAFKLGILDDATATAKLVNMGYAPDDAGILLSI